MYSEDDDEDEDAAADEEDDDDGEDEHGEEYDDDDEDSCAPAPPSLPARAPRTRPFAPSHYLSAAAAHALLDAAAARASSVPRTRR